MMDAKKIGKALDAGGMKALAAGARRNEMLLRAIKEAVPNWMDCGELGYELQPDGTIKIEASQSQARLLRNALPALRAKLLGPEIRKVVIKVR